MTKKEAAELLVQLYADYSVLCSKYGGYKPGSGTAEAVAMAAQALQDPTIRTICGSGESS